VNWIDRVYLLQQSGDVKRMHTVRTLHEYRVSSHVYGAQLIAVELCHLNGIWDSARVGRILTDLLYHDAPEIMTGDMPSPTKRALSDEGRARLCMLEGKFYSDVGVHSEELEAQETWIVACADALDLAMFCLTERELGNRSPVIETVFKNAMSYTEGYTLLGVGEMCDALKELWNEV
jgi:5'-deoxynucleotidase